MNKRSADSINFEHLPARFRARYRLGKKLGEGGVAFVYEVADLQDDTRKALKILKPSYTDNPKAIERFEEEFRILRALHHPSLPEMYDYGVGVGGQHAMVMELVEGVPLNRYFKEHRDEIWLLMLEITEALEFIHMHGLLHLDLKPDNILVRKTGAFGDEKPLITLIDFGLSFRRESKSSVKIVGTPAYMAPEIISGSGRITRAVDYYSLGVTLFELLEGHTPFRGKLDQVLKAHLTREPRFGREQVEYAELYPRVRELLSKDVPERLDAFEDLKRSVSTRAGGALQGLARAYAMGFLDSLGAIGKSGPLERLHGWIERISGGLAERREEMRSVAAEEEAAFDESELERPAPAEKSSDEIIVDSAILAGESGEIDKKIREDLLAAVRERERTGAQVRAKGPIRDASRVMVIAGPAGSGKSYCLDTLRGECLVRGMTPVVLGEGGRYEALVADPTQKKSDVPPVDPRSAIIDRFVRGWERLEEAGRQGGALLMLDGYQATPREEQEFLEYVGKRLELVTDEDKEPGVFVAVTGKTARLRNNIKKLLPGGVTVDGTVLPLPASEDVEEVLAEFHGHLPGVDDRKRLGDYLLAHAESAGALTSALRAALVRGGLEWENGQWRFAESVIKPEKRGETEREYYRELFAELEAEERAVIAWLSCQRGWMPVASFGAVSGIDENRLDLILERIHPFRIVDIREDKRTTSIGIISESVRSTIYRLLNKEERTAYHSAYLHFLSELEAGAAVCESMAFHYESIGETHQGLLMRVRALRLLKEAREIFGMRRLCEEGIRIAARLRSKKWKARKWHLERYFIKQWIEAEWMVSNFRGLIDVVDKYIYKKKRQLPLGFVYMYGMALRSVGEFKKCGELVSASKKSLKKKDSEPYLKILLVEAALLNNIGNYAKSIELLEQIGKTSVTGNSYILSKSYLYYILNHDELGDFKKASIFIDKSLKHAKRFRLYDDYYFAKYYKTLIYFNRSQYSKARHNLISSIKRTNNLKLYSRLANMYHLLSGVYYEEGSYHRALKFLRKAIELGIKLGILNWVNSCYLSYSYIYEHMGHLKEAIYFAELAQKKTLIREWKGTNYVSLVQLFYLFTIMNSEKNEYYKKVLNNYPTSNISQDDVGFYHYVLGIYHMNKGNYSQAIISFEEAYSLYKSTKMHDDALRSQIKIASVSIILKDFSRFEAAIKKIEENIDNIESFHLKNEYNYLYLCYYMSRDDMQLIIEHKTIAEQGLEGVLDVQLYMKICSTLVIANLKLGDVKRAKELFRKYYLKFNILVNHIEVQNVKELEQYKRLIMLSKKIRVAMERHKNKKGILNN